MADAIGGVTFGRREFVRSQRRSPARNKCRWSGGKSRVARHSDGGQRGRRDDGLAAVPKGRQTNDGYEDDKPSPAAAVMASHLDTSCFSLRTESLAEVRFERVRCNKFADLSLTCSRFTAEYRYPDSSFSSAYNGNGSSENENIHDHKSYSLPVTHKSYSRISEDKIELKNYDTVMINQVLVELGFMCNNNDKMYTMQPSKIYFYQQNITSSDDISLLKLDSSTDLHFENLSVEDKIEPILFKLSPERNYYIHNDMDENRNYYQMQSITPHKNEYTYAENKYSPLSPGKKSPYKYWLKRHMLFSKFDHGILLDEESLYSVCPEILSYHIAKRCKNNIALDPFCGAGGNIIQLAFTCKLVLAIDIDPNKIKLAKHNAEIYGIADKIEFIVGDFFAISSMLKADVIYMSPPWGGPEYLDDESFSIGSICKKKFYGGFSIFDIVKKIAPSIAFHMPKTTNIYECLWLANDFGKVETQQNIINGKFNSITAFYGEFTGLTNDDY